MQCCVALTLAPKNFKKEYAMSLLNARYLRKTIMCLLYALSTQVVATEMVYYPYNPSFGGSPLNGPVLLNSALATNKHNPPDIESDRYGMKEKSALDNFKETLERSILNRMATAATSKMLDANGNFVPGIFETENFTITIADAGGDLLTITTLDKSTGSSTVFQVSKQP